MIVLDCSAAIEISRLSDLGHELGGYLVHDGERVIAPSLFYAEVASALRKVVLSGELDLAQANRKARIITNLVDRYVDVSENYVEALAESVRLGHSSYDMFYFTLARREAARLMTLDRRLATLCREQGVGCIGPE